MAAVNYSERLVRSVSESHPANDTTVHEIFVPNENVREFVSVYELNPELGDIIQ